jgi:hypothetical protein
MREKHDFGERKKTGHTPLTHKKLAHILRQTTTERDAAETYKNLTGAKIPDAKQEG